MAVKVWVPAAALAFAVGIATGVAGERNSLLPTSIHWTASDKSLDTTTHSRASNFHDLLADIIKDKGFILTSVQDYRTHCNLVVTARLYSDYFEVKQSQGYSWFVPYAAIYRVDREGPGSVTVPVVYVTAFPLPRFCGD